MYGFFSQREASPVIKIVPRATELFPNYFKKAQSCNCNGGLIELVISEPPVSLRIVGGHF